MSLSNNHVIGSILIAGRDIHVGDNVYHFAQEPEQAILFLRVTSNDGGYQTELFVRVESAELAQRCVALLDKPVPLPDLQGLFAMVKEFERRRINPSERMRQLQPGPGPAALEEQLAEEIFQRCFVNQVGVVVQNFLADLAASKLPGLLLVIAAPDAEVRNIPWEMVLDRLCGRASGFALQAISFAKFALVRTMEPNLEAFKVALLPATAGPLRLLFVTALPESLQEEAKFLEMEAEQKKLIDAVGHLEASGEDMPKIVVEFLDVASLHEIRAVIQKRQHHIVHISGHGTLDPQSGRGLLILEDEQGNEKPATGEELATALIGHEQLRLVVLSACETAVAGLQFSLAEELAGAGVPAVLAMRFAVSDDSAQRFTTAFYDKLATGAPLSAAMMAGREQLYTKVAEARQQAPQLPHMAEWMTPVLLLNQCAGHLLGTRLPAHLPAAFYPHSVFAERNDESRDPGYTRLLGRGFVGRKYQRIQLRRCFQAQPPQHVCLVGMGGMGKTTLAEAFAHSYDQGSHKVIIWRRGITITPYLILSKIAEAFAEWDPGHALVKASEQVLKDDQRTPLDKLKWLTGNCLKGRPNILIFDNLEDLQAIDGSPEARQIRNDDTSGEPSEVAELLGYLLNHAPKDCHLLITTRYALAGIDGPLQHIHLRPLGYAEHYRLMNLDEGLRKIGDQDRIRVYARLGGLPRAYEFLAALAKKSGFRWQDLESELGAVEAKVFADLLLKKIVDLLDDDHRRLFLQASVFFTRTSAAALAYVSGLALAEVEAQLAQLRAWSLVVWDEEAFEVHPLTRTWVGQEGLLEAEERKRVAFGAGEYFRDLPTVGDLELAVEYLALAEAWEDFAEEALRLQDFLQGWAQYDRAIVLCDRVLTQMDVPHYQAAGLLYKGKILFHCGKFQEALPMLEHSLAIHLEIGDRVGEGLTLNNLAAVAHGQGDYPLAQAYFERSLRILQEVGDRNGESAALNNLSRIYQLQEDYPKAMTSLDCSLEIMQVIGNRAGEGKILNNLATLAHLQEDYPKALAYLERSLKIRKEIGDRAGEGTTLNNLGLIYQAQEDYPKALAYLERSLQIRQEIGDRAGEGVTLNNFSLIYHGQEDYPKAQAYLERSLQIQQEIGDRAGEGSTLNNLAVNADAQGDHLRALAYLERSLQIQQEIGDSAGMAKTYQIIGTIAFEHEDYEAAIPYLLQAYMIFEKLGSPNQQDPTDYLNAIWEKIGETRFQEIVTQIGPIDQLTLPSLPSNDQ